MKILASLEEEFPLSPMAAVDVRKYYEAFQRAETVLAAAPKQFRETAERQLNELTSHFYGGGDGVGALYRRRNDASEFLIELWLSSVRQLAGWYVAANSIRQFDGIDRGALRDLPRRFNDPADLPKVAPWLAEHGIALVYENTLPGMKLDGAIFKAPSGQIVVGMSLRYTRLDYYWFTLLHELGHAVLHAERLESPILDDFDAGSNELIEQQADRLASDCLIPRNEWRSCPARYSNSEEDIAAFARKLNIPPQCVAGRLRKELGRYDLFSEIVNKYNVREILGGAEE